MNKIIKHCIVCKRQFEVWPSWDRVKCCSHKCSDIAQRGRKLSFAHRKKLSKVAKQKGFGKWMIGKKASLETIRKHKALWRNLEYRKHMSKIHKGRRPWNKNKKLPQYSGKNSCHWKGGKIKVDGYVLIKTYTHPFRTKNNYILRSHLVMEKMIGRFIKPQEIVHHKGIKYPMNSLKNKGDDRPINLHLFPNVSAHRRYHANPYHLTPTLSSL